MIFGGYIFSGNKYTFLVQECTSSSPMHFYIRDLNSPRKGGYLVNSSNVSGFIEPSVITLIYSIYG